MSISRLEEKTMSTRRIGVMIGAGAALVGIVAVILWPGGGGDAPGPAEVSEQVAAASGAVRGAGGADGSFGIRAAVVDSAVRTGGPVPGRSALAGEGERAVADGLVVAAPDGLPPPRVIEAPTVVPSVDAIAESEEIQAAQPGAQAIVDAWLASRRAKIQASCWDGDDLPESASFFAEVTYSAEGSLLALSVSDSGAPAAVRGCVSAVRDLVPSQIEAPGIPVTVRGTLTLP
jgi:hypothetical protein